jgi:hypothetical protein
MSGVVPYIAGWGAFGFAVRVVALAIQQRPFLESTFLLVDFFLKKNY